MCDPTSRDAVRSAVVRWLRAGQGGLSSWTIAHVLAPPLARAEARGRLGSYGPGSVPRDPSDFRRCVDLLDAMEVVGADWRGQLHRVAEAHPRWSGLVANWAELEELLREEIAEGTGKAPRLYRRIQSLIREVSDVG